jgi:hypothetical protein
MVETKSVTSQILEYTNLVQNAKTKGFNLEENIQPATLIEKLPPSWSDYAKSLRHHQGSLSMTNLVKSLKTEDIHRLKDQK